MKKGFLIMTGLIISAATQSQVFENNVSNAYEKSQSEFERFDKTTTGSLNIFIFTRERKNKIDLLALRPEIRRINIPSFCFAKNFSKY